MQIGNGKLKKHASRRRVASKRSEDGSGTKTETQFHNPTANRQKPTAALKKHASRRSVAKTETQFQPPKKSPKKPKKSQKPPLKRAAIPKKPATISKKLQKFTKKCPHAPKNHPKFHEMAHFSRRFSVFSNGRSDPSPAI